MKDLFVRLAIALLTLPSCVHVAEGRAELDLTVGRADRGLTRVTVEDGLAAVRKLEPGELSLWAQSPVLSIALSVGPEAGGLWSITVENSLADAELTARGAAGEQMATTLAEAPYPTQKRWTLDVPAGADVVLSLRPPDADLIAPFRFAVFADVQERLDDVQDIYEIMKADPSIRFALISGDLTSRGTDEQLSRFQREMKTLPFPCYATLGNHELGTRDDAFHDFFGRGNYSFVFRGAQFTLLDSASATIGPLVYGWLSGWLDEGARRTHVVVMHIPPIDPVGTRSGSFASRPEADKLLVMLAEHGVDLTFYGHVHSYYAFENAGIPAYISGGGGAIPERLDGIGRHFLTVDVSPPAAIEEPSIVRVD